MRQGVDVRYKEADLPPLCWTETNVTTPCDYLDTPRIVGVKRWLRRMRPALGEWHEAAMAQLN